MRTGTPFAALKNPRIGLGGAKARAFWEGTHAAGSAKTLRVAHRQALAATAAAGVNNRATRTAGHARTKAVRTLAFNIAGLKSPFHNNRE